MGAFVLISLIVCVSILLMLIRPRGIAEVYWVGGGAVLLVATRLISPRLAGRAIAEGLDVYLFLIGMMLLSELAREQGVFDWLASIALQRSRGSRARLFLLVYGIGTLVTIFMSNDATAVVLTPAILAIVRKAKVPPLPYLFACALIANAASFVLPISNPANLVVFRRAMPPLGLWMMKFALPSAISILVTYAVIRYIFRRDLQDQTQDQQSSVPLTDGGRLVLIGLAIIVAVLLTTSAFGRDLGLPTCIAALIVTGVVSAKCRRSPAQLFREISWSTLGLVAGLFIMVDAMRSIGALQWTAAAMHWVEHLPLLPGSLLTASVVGVANNLMNNLPLGLIAGTVLQNAQVHGVLATAVLIGVDLGPNLSVTGSLATILWLIALRREGLNVRFWDFLKVGVLAMPLALLLSTLAASLLGFVARA